MEVVGWDFVRFNSNLQTGLKKYRKRKQAGRTYSPTRLLAYSAYSPIRLLRLRLTRLWFWQHREFQHVIHIYILVGQPFEISGSHVVCMAVQRFDRGKICH